MSFEELKEIFKWEGHRNWFRPAKSLEEVGYPIENRTFRDALIRIGVFYLGIFIGVPLMLLWTLYAHAETVSQLAIAYGIPPDKVKTMAMAYTVMILIYWHLLVPWGRFWVTENLKRKYPALSFFTQVRAVPIPPKRITEEEFEKLFIVGVIGGLLALPFAMMLKQPATAVTPTTLLILLWIGPAAETQGVVGVIAEAFRIFLGIVPGIIIAGLSFAMFHIFLLATDPANLIPLFILGALFATLGLMKRSLLPPFIAHILVNLFSLIF